MPTINRLPRKPKEFHPRKNTDRRKERAEIYNTPEWKKLRNAYLMAHPLCEMCLKEGRITPSEQVHHKDSFMNYEGLMRMNVALDPNNLMCVCQECHNKIHNKKGKKN